jgi:hypothetical protein
MKPAVLGGALWIAALRATVHAEGAPKIQFDQTLFDFGKTSQVATVSGVFKFKNVGDTVLKLEPPKVAVLKNDTLAPGASGELPFTLNLGQFRSVLEKHIAVKSNDPKNPEVTLAIRVDYTPLYELNPTTLSPSLAYGVDEATQVATLTRTDGKPLKVARLGASKPWITATLEPGGGTNGNQARVHVSVHRDGLPRKFYEYVYVYGPDETNAPITSIYLYGSVTGEVSLSPEALYWSITDATKALALGTEAGNTRRVTIRSATGRPLELKNLQSTIQGLKVELVPKEDGKVYELVTRLENAPTNTVSGHVSFETSIPDQARMEVPVIVNVFKQ